MALVSFFLLLQCGCKDTKFKTLDCILGQCNHQKMNQNRYRKVGFQMLIVHNTSRKAIFYDNFLSFWTRHSEHSCHIGPFSYHIRHFLSFWTMSQKTMFSTSASCLELEYKFGFFAIYTILQSRYLSNHMFHLVKECARYEKLKIMCLDVLMCTSSMSTPLLWTRLLVALSWPHKFLRESHCLQHL